MPLGKSIWLSTLCTDIWKCSLQRLLWYHISTALQLRGYMTIEKYLLTGGTIRTPGRDRQPTKNLK